MQSFRFVEKRWCLHVDIVTPGDAFLPQNNMLTRQRVLNVFSAVSSGQTPRNQSSFAVTVSPRDYVLPYEQFRFRMQDVSAMSGIALVMSFHTRTGIENGIHTCLSSSFVDPSLSI
jgi:hypothetical protein